MANLILKRLKANNVFSFDKIDVPLNNFQILQIVGKNLDEQHKGEEDDLGVYPSSNGTGKTSIYNLITEALYSKNLSRIKKTFIKNINSKNNEGFNIELEYELDNEEYLLTYSSKECKITKGKQTIVTGRKGVTDYFEEFLPYDLFVALTYMSPKYKIPFFAETDKYKKEFINKCFIDLQIYTAPYSSLLEYDRQISAEITGVNSYKALISKELEEVIHPEKELIPCHPPVKDTEKEKELREKLKEIADILQKDDVEMVQYNQLKKMYNQLKQYETLPDFNKEEYEVAKKEKYILEEELRKYKEIKDYSVCPKCGSKLNKDENTKVYNQVIAKYTEICKKVKELAQKEREYVEAEAGHKNFLSISKQYNDFTFSNSREKIEELKKLKAKIEEELQEINNKYQKEYEEYLEIKEKNLKIQAFNEEQRYKKNRKAKVEKEIQELEEKRTNLTTLLSQVRILQEVFSPKGLIAYKLPERLELLNDQVNSILLSFTTQFRIKFKIIKEKIEVFLLKGEREYPVENCSEGEYTRISLALLLALRNIFSITQNFSINILFLDEIFGSLDLVGREKLLEVLKEFNLNTLLVSHSSYYFNLPTLDIIKKEGKSVAQLYNEK